MAAKLLAAVALVGSVTAGVVASRTEVPEPPVAARASSVSAPSDPSRGASIPGPGAPRVLDEVALPEDAPSVAEGARPGSSAPEAPASSEAPAVSVSTGAPVRVPLLVPSGAPVRAPSPVGEAAPSASPPPGEALSVPGTHRLTGLVPSVHRSDQARAGDRSTAPEPARGSPRAGGGEHSAASPPAVALAPSVTPPAASIAPVMALPPEPASAPRATPADRVAEEAVLLREAHGALARGDGAGALRHLDVHAARFPSGVLVEERRAARVFALCAAGRAADARSAADTFLAASPRSPLAAQVRRACAR